MPEENHKKTCGECIHLHACQLWNIGRLDNTKADSCAVFETVQDSLAYYFGMVEGQQDSKMEYERGYNDCLNQMYLSREDDSDHDMRMAYNDGYEDGWDARNDY